MWDAAGGSELATLAGHSARVVACTFSPDGTRIASAGYDHVVRVWVVASGACARVLEGHDNWVLSARFSGDDGGARIVSASWDNTARVWDASSGVCLRTLRHQNTVNDAAFSPDGTRIATAPYDGAVKVWDATTATCTATLPGHEGAVNALAFAQDGTLASVSDDATVRVWGYPPLYRWLAGLCLEAYYEPLAARGHRELPDVEQVSEADLDAVAMSGDEASRFLDYAPLLREAGYALPAREPVEELRAFVTLFVGAGGARSLVERLGLATVEELGGVNEEALVDAGCPPAAAARLVEAAAERGYGEIIRRRREEARRRAREAERLAGIMLRSSPEGVSRALLALQTGGAPPTATAFFMCHARADAEDAAAALGDDLVAVADDIIGHAIDEVWCGHQTFPTDTATEAAMLNGVRGATAFLLFLTRDTLNRPYCAMECRAALAIRKPIIVVHEPDARWGGAELSEIQDSAPEDLAAMLDTAPVVQHRRKPDERRLMMADIFRAVRNQGGVFHALISISAHASLLAEVAQLREALAAEKELVLELGQSTLVSEINMLKAELEQETAATTVERRRADELAESVKRLTAEAGVWERNLARSLDREAEARRSVEELTDTIERLQGADALRESQLAAGGDELSRLSAAMRIARREEDMRHRSALHKVTTYALAGLFQSIAGGRPSADVATLLSFLQYIQLPPDEANELVSSLRKAADGGVDSSAWAAMADLLLKDPTPPPPAADQPPAAEQDAAAALENGE